MPRPVGCACLCAFQRLPRIEQIQEPSPQSLTTCTLTTSLFSSFGSVQSPGGIGLHIFTSRAIKFLLVRHRSGREYLYVLLLLRAAISAANGLVILSAHLHSTNSLSIIRRHRRAPIAARSHEVICQSSHSLSSTFVFKHTRISPSVFTYSTDTIFWPLPLMIDTTLGRKQWCSRPSPSSPPLPLLAPLSLSQAPPGLSVKQTRKNP